MEVGSGAENQAAVKDYARVPILEEDAAGSRLPGLRRWARRAAWASAGLGLLALGAWTLSRSQSLPIAAKAGEAQELFGAALGLSQTCARFGCLDVRTNNACGCSSHCVEDGNCCVDFHPTCNAPQVHARLGVWPGCQVPGPVVPPPGGWQYVPHGPPLKIKVLSYNPEWWHVIEQLNGNGNGPAKVIAMSNTPIPFDFIGFQEFYDPWYGLTRPGFDGRPLLKEFKFFRGELGGPVGTVIGYRDAAWVLIEKGQGFVGEDRKGPTYFGRRIALWGRFQHRQTGKTVFFMNHHGPLPSNTGGVCGGMTTSHNLLKLIATHAANGDAIVFVGDFNANAASVTIQQVSARLHRLMGGIDNIFTNVPPANVINKFSLPNGGSDHAAIAAVLDLP